MSASSCRCFLCFRLWAHISSSSLRACVAGPIHRYDQAQAGGVLSFPWAAEGSWISKYLLPLCPLILSFAPLLLSFSFSPLLPTLWACLWAFYVWWNTPRVSEFTAALCTIPFTLGLCFPFLPSFSPFAAARGLCESRQGLLWHLSHCWPSLAGVPNCIVFLARIQCLNSELKPNLFPNQNRIKDLPRKCALDFFKIRF